MKTLNKLPPNLIDALVLATVYEDSMLFLKGECVGEAYAEDGIEMFNNLQQIGHNLAGIMETKFHEVDIELEEADIEEWNFNDVAGLLFAAAPPSNPPYLHNHVW
jgi:hypothetical protein